MTRIFALAAALSLPLFGSAAQAQIAVSANDGKAALIDGVTGASPSPAEDSVTIIDLGASPPKVLGEVKAPTSVVGPPQSVAIAKDESYALVTGGMKIDPADPKKFAPDDKLSVIDLKANPPAVIQTLQAGGGATGVSINRTGTLALVANRAEGTMSIFAISGKTLTPAGKLDFGKASQPSHVAFTPDGKTAILTRDGDHRVSILSVDGAKVEDTKKFMVGGYRPYSLEISAKGDVAVFGNQGGGQGDADVINVVDLKMNPPRVVDTISVGQTPEGVGMSGDGSMVAVSVQNGTNKAKGHPAYNDFGLLKVFSVKGTKLTFVAETRTGKWCQGVVFSRDNKTVAIQCMIEKDIELFRLSGRKLTPAGTIRLPAGGAGLRTADR